MDGLNENQLWNLYNRKLITSVQLVKYLPVLKTDKGFHPRSIDERFLKEFEPFEVVEVIGETIILKTENGKLFKTEKTGE